MPLLAYPTVPCSWTDPFSWKGVGSFPSREERWRTTGLYLPCSQEQWSMQFWTEQSISYQFQIVLYDNLRHCPCIIFYPYLLEDRTDLFLADLKVKDPSIYCTVSFSFASFLESSSCQDNPYISRHPFIWRASHRYDCGRHFNFSTFFSGISKPVYIVRITD